MKFKRLLFSFVAVIFFTYEVFSASILFDASKHEMAGNADWVIDADVWNLNMPAYPCTGNTNESNPQQIPSPPQSGITSSTPETYWTGGISSWAIDLVKTGHAVETLPSGGRITFGDITNPQDLQNYQLFIIVEPQIPFTAAEKAAILSFVNAGGGLFMVADHETSDRDCDGWDSPSIFNDLTGATSTTTTGVFGIWFRVNGVSDKGSEDWFDDGIDNNVETNPTDPIIFGSFGSGAGGLGLFGATSMDINPLDNPNVSAHVWRTSQAHNNLRVTFSTSLYGSGRVAAIGDSSPADDSTGDPSDTLYPGWDKATGGVNNREIHLNACAWLLNPAPDTTPPSITGGPSSSPSDCSANITWVTDEPATSLVDYGLTSSYGNSTSVPGYSQSHNVTLSMLGSSTLYHYRVSSSDSSGNGPTSSGDAIFTTTAPTLPIIITGPSTSNITGTSAVITWQTDEPSTSQVEYGLTSSYGSNGSASGFTINHSVTLTSLTSTTTYHYRVLSTDTCGNGPSVSGDFTFTTGSASIDVSGWQIKQFNSTQVYTIPAGTSIPSGGYLIVARDSTRAQFSAFFPSLPSDTIFLNSNATGSCTNGCLPQINGGETFELWNTSAKVEGPTIAMVQNNSYQRKNPGDPAGQSASWNVLTESSANPGQGAGTGSSAGVVINEMSDASDYTKEFVELYYDADLSPPDTLQPATITDLTAMPLSSSTIRLNWTASGDDGSVGTASSYDIRMSSSPILSNNDFNAAVQLAGEPSPSAAGSAEQFMVNNLNADSAYYFAMKVSDEVPNTSGLSNYGSAVTAPAGSDSANHLVISQIQTNGDGTTPSDDEFIEIYNPTLSSVLLAGWSIQYKSATGSTYTKQNITSGNVVSHGYYLITRSAYNGFPAPDLTNTSFLMAAAGGNIYLVNDQVLLTSCSSASIVDKAAWGTGNCPETAAVTAPSANNSVMRNPGGTQGSGQDTDNNQSDFQSQIPSNPHNSSNSPATPPSSLGNVGNTLFLATGVSATNLTWANASGASAYRIYRGTTPGFMGGSPVPWQTSSVNNHNDATIPSPILFYVIRATDGTNESAD